MGFDHDKLDLWAKNDYWYDEVSDGAVSARVTVPSGKSIVIDRPQDAAWLIVAPPKYALGIHSIVTLYDVIHDVAVDQGWIKDAADVCYFRDIHPILWRAAETSWVNAEARRGHADDKRGDFRAATDRAAPTTEQTKDKTHSSPSTGRRI